ncbi:hypothetical protein NPIL_313101 [Nephila pilipes]|uniref:Uncharacterized protein n=1 Tax=Nephila pilipes TaxID=299642 RepID=A0A8X6NEX2_NEPPI|nr:hypothetical protein NPIL_313101 [Nephila pilipes]
MDERTENPENNSKLYLHQKNSNDMVRKQSTAVKLRRKQLFRFIIHQQSFGGNDFPGNDVAKSLDYSQAPHSENNLSLYAYINNPSSPVEGHTPRLEGLLPVEVDLPCPHSEGFCPGRGPHVPQ